MFRELKPRRLLRPAVEAASKGLATVSGFFDGVRRRGAARRQTRDEVRSRIEAKADRWMASAPPRDVERMRRYTLADAHEVVDLLVLSALDGDNDLMVNFTETVDIFAQRVILTARDLEPVAGPPGEQASVEPDTPYVFAKPPESAT